LSQPPVEVGNGMAGNLDAGVQFHSS
jgi:two-component sensor histidine kinase